MNMSLITLGACKREGHCQAFRLYTVYSATRRIHSWQLSTFTWTREACFGQKRWLSQIRPIAAMLCTEAAEA